MPKALHDWNHSNIPQSLIVPPLKNKEKIQFLYFVSDCNFSQFCTSSVRAAKRLCSCFFNESQTFVFFNWRSQCPSTLSSMSTEGVFDGEAKLVAHSSRRPMGTTPPRLTACPVSPSLHLGQALSRHFFTHSARGIGPSSPSWASSSGPWRRAASSCPCFYCKRSGRCRRAPRGHPRCTWNEEVRGRREAQSRQTGSGRHLLGESSNVHTYKWVLRQEVLHVFSDWFQKQLLDQLNTNVELVF